MPGYSLVQVDYQPDFGDYSLVPVDYDPFAADGVPHRRRFNKPRPSRKARRSNSQQREPVNPVPVRRLQVMVPAAPTRIKAQPKLLPLAATPIRRQRSLLSIGPC